MKKFLTLALVAMMSLVANAQFKKSPQTLNIPKTAPAKTAAIEGTDLWGYYLGSSLSDAAGLGTGQAGSFRVAIKVPGDGVFAGAKIRGLNIPALSAMTKVSGWLATGTGNSTKVVNKSVTISNTPGYTVLEFDEPVEIPAEGLYAGYTFTSTDAYPIAIIGDDTPGGLFLATTATGALEDYSAGGFGVSPLQVFVEGMLHPVNGAVVKSVSCEAAAKGAESSVHVSVMSFGSNGVNNVGYTLSVNGVETTGSLSVNIPAGMNQAGAFEVPFTAPDEIGAFPASFAITTINGETNELAADATAFAVNTVSRIAPRMTVVEEFTGTGCGWCPRGWVGMEAVKNNQSDKALVVAWHKYNSSDPMYQGSYANIPFDGAPQCTVDRKVFPDPYYGEGEEGVMECVNKYSAVVPTVDVVNLKARFEDETNKKVVVSSDTEFLTNTQGYTIAFVLTADSLCGTTSSWKQSNYYAQQYNKNTFTGALPEMPELAEFCSGGEWGKSSVALVFNDVLIGSTYNAQGKSQVAAFTTGQAGDIEASEYTITMPTKAALVNALKYDKIYLTAIVVDKNGQIANAKRVRVLGAGEPEPGTDPVVGNGVISPISEEYQLICENMSSDSKYVVGVNFATYAPAAWNTESGEVIDFPDYEEGTFHAANNSGIFVGDNGVGEGQAIKADAQGNVTELYRFVGEEIETEWGTMTTGDAGSSAFAISEDGKMIAGFYFNAAYKTTPCIWNENNERIDLPLPTAEEAGFYIDGGEVRWMSADGKVLAGFLIDNFGTWPACIWRQNAQGGYDVDVVCKNFWEEGYQMGKPYMVFNPSGISANGEWLALSVQAEFDDWDFSAPRPAMQVARLNLNTMTLEVLNGEDVSYAPSGIANDGTMLAYSGAGDMFGRSGYLWAAGKTTLTSLDDVLATAGELDALASNTPCAISADGKKVQGFGANEIDFFSYVIDITDIDTAIENATVHVNKISSDKIYNLQGQQVKNINASGLYIKGGKKILK